MSFGPRRVAVLAVVYAVPSAGGGKVFEMSRPLAEPTLRPTMSAKDEMTPARSRAPREVSASAASSRPRWEEYMATAQHT